jgi:hypothetical protein
LTLDNLSIKTQIMCANSVIETRMAWRDKARIQRAFETHVRIGDIISDWMGNPAMVVAGNNGYICPVPLDENNLLPAIAALGRTIKFIINFYIKPLIDGKPAVFQIQESRTGTFYNKCISIELKRLAEECPNMPRKERMNKLCNATRPIIGKCQWKNGGTCIPCQRVRSQYSKANYPSYNLCSMTLPKAPCILNKIE